MSDGSACETILTRLPHETIAESIRIRRWICRSICRIARKQIGTGLFSLMAIRGAFFKSRWQRAVYRIGLISHRRELCLGGDIQSTSTGKVFTFPTNLSGSTLNKRLVIATNGFGTLPGAVAPDFTLPSTNFFNPAGDTLTLSAGVPIDFKTFTSVPTDGRTARHYIPTSGAASLGTNTPTNYAGATGSVNVAVPESATIALMLSGLAAVWMRRKRHSCRWH